MWRRVTQIDEVQWTFTDIISASRTPARLWQPYDMFRQNSLKSSSGHTSYRQMKRCKNSVVAQYCTSVYHSVAWYRRSSMWLLQVWRNLQQNFADGKLISIWALRLWSICIWFSMKRVGCGLHPVLELVLDRTLTRTLFKSFLSTWTQQQTRKLR